MLEARDLAFSWSRAAAPVIDGVSLSIGDGEIVGLVGPSGTGKTTLAKILAGHLRPSAGRVLLDGQPLPDRGSMPVQLVFQHAETAVDPRWPIARSLEEGWLPDAETRRAFGISADWLDRRPHELSGGELQRVAIVRALVPGLRVLIADELTAMHDAISQVRIWTTLLDIARSRGFAILAISHDEALLAAIGARVVALPDGRRDAAVPSSPP